MKDKLLLTLGIILVIGSGLLLYFYSKSVTPSETEQKSLKVAASIFPLYDIVKNIIGDKGEVIQILPAGVSPHTFEPKIQDQERINGSDLVFVIGQGLDNWANNLLTETNSNSKFIDVSNNISLLTSEDPEDGAFDPHYWLSISNAQKIADNVAAALSNLDRENQDYYAENLYTYQQELAATLASALEKVATLSKKQFITFHDAFNYFAQELGLEVIATIEPFPGKEPTPSYLAEVGAIIQGHNIKVLFKEPQLSDAIVSALAQDYGATVKTLDPEGALQELDSFIKLYNYNVETVVEALK